MTDAMVTTAVERLTETMGKLLTKEECEYAARIVLETAAPRLMARLKRTSKYYGQTEPGAWFDVRVVADTYYHLRGNNNNYRLSDVALGMRLDGGIVVDLASGKTVRT